MLRIIFAGTPDLSSSILQSLLATKNFDLCACFTQPDKPSGRGRKLTENPVKQFAKGNNIPVYQPTSLKNKEIVEQISMLSPDVIVVVAYGMILPKDLLNIPKYGCINVHMSLLPKWRGAAPIQHAILSGDEYTGVTIMQMDSGLDTGDILSTSQVKISHTDTSKSLQEKLANIGSEELIKVLNKIPNECINSQKQDDSKASYANKITKEMAKINWNLEAIQIERQIRAFNPWPISFTQLEDVTVRIWRATIINNETTNVPGTIISTDKNGIKVATGDGVLNLQKIQLSGKNSMNVVDMLNAKSNLFAPGKQFR